MTTILSVSTPRKKHRLSKMRFDRVSLVPAGDDPAAQVVISKAASDIDDGGNMDPEVISKADLPQDVVEYIDGLESEIDTLTKSESDLQEENDRLTKELEEAQDGSTVVKTEAEQFEALLEKADPAVRVLLKKQREETEELRKQAEDERNQRLEREFISKAEQFPMLSENKTDLGGVLRRISEGVSAEDYAYVEKMLTAANTQISKGNLFAEFGRTGGETTVSKSVDAAAEAIRKDHPEMTMDQARAKAYEDNPDLFAQAMTEGR